MINMNKSLIERTRPNRAIDQTKPNSTRVDSFTSSLFSSFCNWCTQFMSLIRLCNECYITVLNHIVLWSLEFTRQHLVTRKTPITRARREGIKATCLCVCLSNNSNVTTRNFLLNLRSPLYTYHNIEFGSLRPKTIHPRRQRNSLKKKRIAWIDTLELLS